MGQNAIRVGIIGAGANTRSRHIPGLQAIDGVRVAAVCNRSRASSQRVAEAFNIPRVFENWNDLVEDPDVDAIVIGTWPYMHCPATLAALRADKHVLTEARMAMNAAEAHAMRDQARARPHLVAQIVPSPMTLRVDATIQRMLADGELGELFAVELREGGEWINRTAPMHWRQDVDLSGTNTMSLGIWYEAIMRWVGHAARVAAMGKTFVKMRKDKTGRMRSVRVPEHLDVIAEMECGAQAHLQISSVAAPASPTEVCLFGSEGALRFSQDKLYGCRRGEAEFAEIVIPPDQEGAWRVEEEFIEAIRGEGIITHTTFDDGVKYMEFTEAVARSIATGRTIPLPLAIA